MEEESLTSHALSQAGGYWNSGTALSGPQHPRSARYAAAHIFVSSTCYDLMDLRSELESFLKDLGFAPVLSDRPSSDFEAPGDRDSIETCLVNVRRCPVFICVLSQRYGPRLGKVGFDDISATHLEYREARKVDARIYFYVRDRLDADYEIWRANPMATDLRFRWVKDPRDFGLFPLIREHDDLKKDGASNWKWPFRDSLDLKARLGFDLKARSRKLLLRKMLEGGQVPAMSLSPVSAAGPEISLDCRNVGPTTAFDVAVRFAQVSEWTHLGDFPGGYNRRQALRMPSPGATHMPIEVRYSTLAGDVLEQMLEWRNESNKISIRRKDLRFADTADAV